jgi:hypothetical protein
LTKVSDEFLLCLSALPCPNLKEVNLAGQANMTDFGVTALACRMPMLQKLDVSCCAAVSEDILAFCPVVVANTDPVGDAGQVTDSTSTESDGMDTTD